MKRQQRFVKKTISENSPPNLPKFMSVQGVKELSKLQNAKNNNKNVSKTFY
jgi:hypothetical protein